MKGTFRQSMTWLHTWVGLLVCWVLYFVFLTGTLGYFDTELDHWAQPDILKPQTPVDISESVRLAQTRLEQKMPHAAAWYINPPADRNELYLWAAYETLPSLSGEEGVYRGEELNPLTGQPLQLRDTGGGQTLYRMHYALRYMPRSVATWLVGVCTMFMLLALLTGIVIHKKIFKDFFTFRPGKRTISWIDAHNLFGVMSLPFHLMITYSGLVMFLFTYMPLVVAGSYGFQKEGYDGFRDGYMNYGYEVNERSGVNAPVMDLGVLFQRAEEKLGEGQVRRMQVYQPGDANSVAVFEAKVTSPLSRNAEVVFSAVTGEYLLSNEVTDVPKLTFYTLLELHEGLFAEGFLRWAYFLSGVLGTAMIATGSILWCVKRRRREQSKPRGPSLGYRLVEGLNVGTVMGLLVAVVVYFWANRLLPLTLDERAEWEVHCLFLTWLVLLGHGVWRAWQDRIDQAWQEQTLLLVVSCALLPIVNALSTERGLLQSLQTADWVYVVMDISCWLIALVAFWAWRKLRIATSRASSRSKAAIV